jgi:site-specific DNA-methyltransferase (adenine-specific)/adenine-specific DNA-methyltransferase
MEKIIKADLIIWPDEQEGKMQRPRFKTYYDPKSTKPKPVSSWIENLNINNDTERKHQEEEYEVSVLTSGMNQEGGRILQEIMGTKLFAYPKPLSLIKSLVRAATRDTDIVLDSFAGTGTTGHAVLSLNKEDGLNRHFILIEMESSICKNLTAERLRRVCEGYNRPNGKSVEGLGGGFRFCLLGAPCFNELGRINPAVTFADLARHVFFTETGNPLPSQTALKSPLIGKHQNKAVYLLYNGILKDRSLDGGNVLTKAVLDCLPQHDGPKVIYGAACRFSASRLKRENIVFKQIPYEIRTG